MREVFFPAGLSTGIGSLPHDDPDEAALFALDAHPKLPAAPSLPRRSATEGMVAQAAWGIPGVMVLEDGSLLVDAAERTVPDRRRLGFAGIVSVALALSERGELVGEPEIEITGIPEKDADGRSIADAALDAVIEALDSMPRARRSDPDAVAEAARRAVRSAVGSAWNKKPMCHVHVLTV